MSEVVQAGGRSFEIRGMPKERPAGETGPTAVDWGEQQILCARTKAEVLSIAGRAEDHQVRGLIRQLLYAQVALITMATGCEPEFAAQLSTEDEVAIIEAQDRANRMDLVVPWMSVQEQAARMFLRSHAE